MSTFNAGAIEATLTLDRSPFQRDLRAAQQQATRFSNKKITPKLELKGLDDVMQMAAALEGLDSKDITIATDITGKDDLVELAVLINNLDGHDIDLDVDVHGMAELAMLAAAVEALDGKDIDLDVDAGGAGVAAAVGGFSRMQAIVTAVLILLPLVAPVVATLTAVLVGLTAGLVGAAGAIGIVGLAIFPTVKGMMELNEEIQKQEVRLAGLTPGTEAYRKQQEKINNLQKEMNTRFGDASRGLEYMKEKWDAFTKATEPIAQGLVGQALTLIGDAITAFTPIFEAAAPVIKDALGSMSDFIKSGEGKEMVKFFTDFGSQSLRDILDIGGNLLRFLGNLFDAFAPFGGDLLSDIEAMTESWAEWARSLKDSEGFKDFLAYVAEEGPKVWDLIKNIGAAFINFGVALAPLGSVSLDAFNAIFSFIADMDPTILGAIATGLGVAATAILLVSAAMAVFNAVMALNPFVLIAIAVIALVAAIVYLWNTNEGFRDAIIGAWNAILDVIMVAVGWLQENVLPIFTAIWDGIVAGWNFVVEQIFPIISLIVQIIVQGFTLLWNFLSPIIGFIVTVVTTQFRILSSIVMAIINVLWPFIVGAFNAIKTVITTVMNIIKTIWTGAWMAIKTVFSAVIIIIRSILSGILAAMKGDWGAALAFFRNAWQVAWNAIKAVFSIIITTLKSVFSQGLNGMKSAASSILNGIKAVFSNAWNSIVSVLRGFISKIKGAFSGARSWLINAGKSIIQGLIDGIKNMAGNVAGAVRGVLSAARDLLPFSPAKEGPFSGQGWTLYSGRSIIKALGQGMKDETPGLRNAAMDAVSAAQDAMQLNSNVNLNARTPALVGAGGGRNIDVRITAVNPLPERSSTTAIREVTRLGQLGVFDG